jgi:alkanesulfonate monooxygenase SsuD/methylene tetrahydromethanopterin reductase-like flavin-dependent oxidoreductase (luciferase family)
MATATTRVTLAPSFADNLLRSPFALVQASVEMDPLAPGRYEAAVGRWVDGVLSA